jgi:polysaccharide biosynthesis/export protein
MWKIIGIVLALVMTSACSSASGDGQLSADAAGSADLTLSSGDKIKLVVEGEKDFSGEFTVDSAGVITVPVVGAIPIKGMTLAEAASAYGAKLRDGQILRNPKVTAESVGLRPIFVLGEVKRPGQYAFVAGMTIQSAVELAEGYTYYAKESSAEITRGGRTVAVDVSTQIKILPGDSIRIPKRFF